MAALHAASYAACARCLTRRALARPAAVGMGSSTTTCTTSVSTTTVPTRGKKTGRRGDSGVVVRLLQDVPQFGQKETILRIDRGRMRNLWYPRGIADYVTTAGQAVAERDPFFGQSVVAEDEVSRPVVQAVEASRVVDLLHSLPPLVFQRRPITPATASIFGSVSADDVAAALRAALQTAGSEAARVRVDGRDVRFVVAEAEPAAAAAAASGSPPSDDATADRVKALGRWEVEIAVRGSGVAVAPVRLVVEVVAP